MPSQLNLRFWVCSSIRVQWSNHGVFDSFKLVYITSSRHPHIEKQNNAYILRILVTHASFIDRLARFFNQCAHRPLGKLTHSVRRGVFRSCLSLGISNLLHLDRNCWGTPYGHFCWIKKTDTAHISTEFIGFLKHKVVVWIAEQVSDQPFQKGCGISFSVSLVVPVQLDVGQNGRPRGPQMLV